MVSDSGSNSIRCASSRFCTPKLIPVPEEARHPIRKSARTKDARSDRSGAQETGGERALRKAFRYSVDVVRIFAPEKLGKAVNTLVRPVVGQVPRHPDDIADLIHEGGLGAGRLIGPKDENPVTQFALNGPPCRCEKLDTDPYRPPKGPVHGSKIGVVVAGVAERK